VEDFCYLGSSQIMWEGCESQNRQSCNKLRESIKCGEHAVSLVVKIKLYESLILPILLYSAELWPITVTSMKKLEAAHHRWQRKILGVTWKDKLKNEEINIRTGLQKVETIIKERSLRWLGHVMRMDNDRISHQELNWKLEGFKRKPCRETSEKLERYCNEGSEDIGH